MDFHSDMDSTKTFDLYEGVGATFLLVIWGAELDPDWDSDAFEQISSGTSSFMCMGVSISIQKASTTPVFGPLHPPPSEYGPGALIHAPGPILDH